jgi:curved DNA-binding protein
MEFKDYYKVLGVDRSANAETVKKAYRKLARQHHPDISKAADASARMQEVNEAYDVLRDPERRAAYDRVGQGFEGGRDFQPPPGWDAGFEFTGGPQDFADLTGHSDFFEALFGRARRAGSHARTREPPFAARGQDHHAKILVSIEDAFHGATRQVRMQSPALDEQGRVVLHERVLDVNIPKGIRAGQQIRLSGQGAPGSGGAAAGDLYLEIGFEPHRRFRVEGRDLYLDLPVAPWEAALGADVRVPTPDGALDMKVPAGSQAGRKLRLRGRGIPGSPPGDLYLVLKLVLPAADSEAAQAFYRQMAKDLAFDPRADLEG